MKKSFKLTFIIFSITLSVHAENNKNLRELNQDERQQMATMHEKVASCLRSEKTMSQCHEEMMKECPMGESCTMGTMKHRARLNKEKITPGSNKVVKILSHDA